MLILCISYADISTCTSSHVANTNYKFLSTKGAGSWQFSHNNQWEYSVCFVEQKGCRTAECVDTQSKNKGPYSFWTNYKTYSSDALKIRNLERRTVKKLQMWDLKYKDRISPSQKPLCWHLSNLSARIVGVSDLIDFNTRGGKERSWQMWYFASLRWCIIISKLIKNSSVGRKICLERFWLSILWCFFPNKRNLALYDVLCSEIYLWAK